MVHSGQKTIISTEKTAQEIFLVKYFGTPTPDFTLFYNDYKNNRSEISMSSKEDESIKTQLLHIPNEQSIAVIIRNLTIFDTGNYTLIANNGKSTKEKFQLLVKGNILTKHFLLQDLYEKRQTYIVLHGLRMHMVLANQAHFIQNIRTNI